MAEPRDQTVLVTGGSGFLGGWCVIELLRRGYSVRTTVRSLSREPQVRATVGSEVDPGDRLTVLAANLTGDEGPLRRCGNGGFETYRVEEGPSCWAVERMIMSSELLVSLPTLSRKEF